MVQTARGDYESALKYYEQSMSIWEELSYEYSQARTLHEMARVETSRKNYDQARKYAKASLLLKEKSGDRQGYAVTLQELGRILSKQNDLMGARVLSEKLRNQFRYWESTYNCFSASPARINLHRSKGILRGAQLPRRQFAKIESCRPQTRNRNY